jgi:hypothetical protein
VFVFHEVKKTREILIYNSNMILIYEDKLLDVYFLSVNTDMNNLLSDNKCIFLLLNSSE